MAIAAGKLVLVDFGSLGDLGNILALIAAGGVFLTVAWAVPMPPRVAPQAASPSPPSPTTPPPPDTAVPPHAPPLNFGVLNLRPRAGDDTQSPPHDGGQDGPPRPS